MWWISTRCVWKPSYRSEKLLKCGSQNGAHTDLQTTSLTLKIGGDNVFHLGFDIPKGFWKIRILKYFLVSSKFVKNMIEKARFSNEITKGFDTFPFIKSSKFQVNFNTFKLFEKYFKIRIFQNPFRISNPKWNTLSPPVFKLREVIWRSVRAPFWLPHLSNFCDL